MLVKIPFGKYQGKSVEQVAIQDYCYLTWLLQKGIKKFELKDRAEYVINKLNTFVPVVKCSINGCDNPGHYLSIVFKYYGLSGPGISVSPIFAICSEKHFDLMPGRAEQARIYPTKFSMLECFPHRPKWIRQDITKVLCEMAGIRSKRSLEETINAL